MSPFELSLNTHFCIIIDYTFIHKIIGVYFLSIRIFRFLQDVYDRNCAPT
jgi:hypothetical protein